MGLFNPFYAARVKRLLSQIMIGTFVWMSVVPPGPVAAQVRGMALPAPQELVQVSAGYHPAAIKGLVIHPENPLEFD
ncbi:MAG: hypothetical protein K8I82_18855, partial [Anaerolineae bacterium]|nr:hypothetical protein [Anaerolineae bacterium]